MKRTCNLCSNEMKYYYEGPDGTEICEFCNNQIEDDRYVEFKIERDFINRYNQDPGKYAHVFFTEIAMKLEYAGITNPPALAAIQKLFEMESWEVFKNGHKEKEDEI